MEYREETCRAGFSSRYFTTSFCLSCYVGFTSANINSTLGDARKTMSSQVVNLVVRGFCHRRVIYGRRDIYGHPLAPFRISILRHSTNTVIVHIGINGHDDMTRGGDSRNGSNLAADAGHVHNLDIIEIKALFPCCCGELDVTASRNALEGQGVGGAAGGQGNGLGSHGLSAIEHREDDTAGRSRC